MTKPIVATTALGAEDIVEHGQTGLIVAPGDAAALATALERLMQRPQDVREMQRVARQRSAQWGWAAYGRRWAGLLAEDMG